MAKQTYHAQASGVRGSGGKQIQSLAVRTILTPNTFFALTPCKQRCNAPIKMDDDSCIFCSIASGRMRAFVVLNEADFCAFLDHRPLFEGHCLLVPRSHHEVLTDLPEPLLGPLLKATQRLSRAVEEAMAADGYFVAMNNRVSQSVHHLHIHVVPRRKKDGLKGFFWPRHKYESEARMAAVADNITQALHKQEDG